MVKHSKNIQLILGFLHYSLKGRPPNYFSVLVPVLNLLYLLASQLNRFCDEIQWKKMHLPKVQSLKKIKVAKLTDLLVKTMKPNRQTHL